MSLKLTSQQGCVITPLSVYLFNHLNYLYLKSYLEWVGFKTKVSVAAQKLI